MFAIAAFAGNHPPKAKLPDRAVRELFFACAPASPTAVRIAAVMVAAMVIAAARVIAALAADGRIGAVGDPQPGGNRLELAGGELTRRNVNVRTKCHPFYS